VAELKLDSNIFIFSRHGESETNTKGVVSCYPEVAEFPLTKNGVKNVKELARKFKSEGGVGAIYASDLMRTKQTAEIIAKELGIEVVFDDRLRELNVGDYNGKLAAEYEAARVGLDLFKQAPDKGENYLQLKARLLDFVSDINAKHKNKKILVISHGDGLWLLRQHFDHSTDYPDFARPFSVSVSIPDLHRPYIDEITLKCEKCGHESKRVPEVLDVWFDSGAMPFAQWHYPFENQDKIENKDGQFPADYISEAIDQTRGWFYTLLAVSTLLDKGPAYKNVINLGHVLDEKGLKMSKSKGNIVDPWSVINKQGVDALRWYMYSVNQPGDSKLFTLSDVDSVIRKNFMILWNVLSFFVTYSTHDKWSGRISRKNLSILDQMILIKTQDLVNQVTSSLDRFDIFRACRDIEAFIDLLSTWYVRRSRDSKGPALYSTLFEVLRTLARLMAPFSPFFSEMVWQVLKQDKDPESVHLCDWPETKEMAKQDVGILSDMEMTRKMVELGHAARKAATIKVRQPLARVKYWTKDGKPLLESFEQIAVEELNVKKAEHVGMDAAGMRVELDLNITPELKKEGLARDLERFVQEMRKSQGLKVGEFVDLFYDGAEGETERVLEIFDTKKTFVRKISKTRTDGMAECAVGDNRVLLAIARIQ
jgi:isoleucyl-tRNA synthetase